MIKELAKRSPRRKRKGYDKQSKENKMVASRHHLSTGSTELNNLSYLISYPELELADVLCLPAKIKVNTM